MKVEYVDGKLQLTGPHYDPVVDGLNQAPYLPVLWNRARRRRFRPGRDNVKDRDDNVAGHVQDHDPEERLKKAEKDFLRARRKYELESGKLV